MKLCSLIILSLLLLSNSLKVTIVYTWYTVDVDSFIEQLCENKDRPQLKCDGKCYLSKISKDASGQNDQTLPLLEWESWFFFNPAIIFDDLLITTISLDKNFYYLTTFPKDITNTIFHPPQV